MPGVTSFAVFAKRNFRGILARMLLSEDDIEEFIVLARKEGVELSREEAVAAATRLVLLYLRLAMPTPSELAELRLAKTSANATVLDGPQH
jgi:hypothetical protein